MRPRLLERLKAAERNLARRGSEADALADSIERHLSLILNTHQGMSQSAPDFGIPDLASIMGNSDLDNIQGLGRVIADVVAKYEPRVTDVSVGFNRAAKEGGILNFTLNCSLVANGVRRELFFNTLITPDGNVKMTK
jgi:type VI secretion system protein